MAFCPAVSVAAAVHVDVRERVRRAGKQLPRAVGEWRAGMHRRRRSTSASAERDGDCAVHAMQFMHRTVRT